MKGKGEMERYKHLNAEFQRIARRNKKAFLSDQCKEIEENNRMGKTRDLFKKIRDTKGIFHAKMGLIHIDNKHINNNTNYVHCNTWNHNTSHHCEMFHNIRNELFLLLVP